MSDALHVRYQEVLDYFYQALPMFHRVGAAALKPGLDNIRALASLSGDPQEKGRYVHVAGTNGKGSTCHLIASTLQEAGYKTGLFTSPHLVDFRERIRLNGEMIPRDEVVEFVELYQSSWKNLQPSFFEMTTALAFWYFAKMKADIAVIEVGLGGRLDSTNIIQPEVSVITNIGMDHQALLGNTIVAIAREKGGIIKPGIPVVVGPMRVEARKVLEGMAADCQSTVTDASGLRDLPISDLVGNYQEENKRTALATLHVLGSAGWNIPEEAIERGFSQVVENTQFIGRWTVLHQHPQVIVDVAHNEDGIRHVVNQLSRTPHSKLHWVLGMVNDKEIDAVLRCLPGNATYYFCKAAIPRGMDALELKQHAAYFGLRGESWPSVREAYHAAMQAAGQNDLVFVCGSVFVVAEVL